ncbi:MAG: energy transducer TonB [Pseudomonadota bacterium]
MSDLGEADSDRYAQLRRQIELEELDSAEVAVNAVVEDLEAETHRYDAELAEPLLLRGDIAFARGAFEDALDDYGRSVHIRRVNDGLHSPEQVAAVYREARTLERMGLLLEADRREEYAYEVLRKHYGSYSKDLLPGLYHLAQWQEKRRKIFGARRLYGQALLILDAADEAGTSENLIKPLKGLAESYRLERFPPVYDREGGAAAGGGGAPSAELYDGPRPLTLNNFPAGQKALERIVRIRQETAEEDPVALAEAILELADWHLLFEKVRLAGQYYQHAERILNAAHTDAAAALFGEPTLLHYPRPIDPKPPGNRLNPARAQGHVTVKFTVTDRGTTTRLVTVESVPKGLMDFRVRKSLRAARYRPPLLEGRLSEAREQTYRHDFWYYPRTNESAPSGSELKTVADGNDQSGESP